MHPIRVETVVEEDGVLHVEGVRAGDRVEVIVLRLDPVASRDPFESGDRGDDWDALRRQAEYVPRREPRQPGSAKGKIIILPGFDDPIPGFEPYS
jgi:hypothetical protein